MDINKMKVGLSYIFFENQKMDEMTKKQVLSYIEVANMEQLKLLALDGDIHAKLTKDAKKIIDVRFNEDVELMTKIDKAALQGIKELVEIKKKVDSKVIKEEIIKYTGAQIVKLARQHGNTVKKQLKAGCEKWSIKAPFKGQEYRDKMMSCKAKASIKGLNASGMYAKKLLSHCKDGLKCKKDISNFLIDLKGEIKDNQRYVK